jgi:hypothetical protein
MKALFLLSLAFAITSSFPTACAQTAMTSGWFLNFDGIDDRVDLGNFDVTGEAIAIEAWFRADNLDNCPASDCRIISKATGTGEGDHWWMVSTVSTGEGIRLRFRLKSGGSTRTLIASSGNLTNGVWTHVAAVYDGNQMMLYKDGVLVGSAYQSGAIDTNPSARVWIGDNPPSTGSRPFDGSIDEVRIWNKALTQKFIQDNRDKELTGTETGLVAYWKFNEGSGQVAFDSTSNGRNGTLGSTADADFNDPLWTAGGAPFDITPPVVSISEPSNGAVMAGNITISATASDNVGVASIEFKLDGDTIGRVVGDSPTYSITWDTTTTSNCDHTVAAVATDTSGNQTTSSAVKVTVANISSPRTVHYVRAGAQGNNSGSDWANAYPELPETLLRGHTYYVAGGQYRSYVFNDPPCATTVITIKKATPLDHGTDAGWEKSLGDAVAEWGPLTFHTSYYLFDGSTRTSPITGHGFKLKATTAGAKLVRLDDAGATGNPVTNITIRYTEMEHRGRNTETFDDGFYGLDWGKGGPQNITIQYNYLHDFGRAPFLLRSWSNVFIEHNYIARNSSSPTVHSEGISDAGSDNVVVRHNVWKDIDGTAFIAILENGGPSDNWDIYGNVFFHSSSWTGGVSRLIVVLNDASNSASANNWKIYNNSIINLKGLWSGIQIDAGMNNVAYNNLWYNSVQALHEAVTLGYNWYSNTVHAPEANEQFGTGIPFVDLANENFRLISGTVSGLALASPYNTDPDGKTRAADGVWDRGAYEFGCPTVNATVNPGFAAICAGGSVTLTATAAGGSGSYSFFWSPAAGLSSTTEATVVASPAVTTIYTLIAKDTASGCSGTTQVTVTANPALSLSITGAPQGNICPSANSVLLNANAFGGAPPYTFRWTKNGSFLSAIERITDSNLALGIFIYTATVTDNNGCIATATATVPVIDTVAPMVSCPSDRIVSANDACQASIPDILAGVTALDNCTPPSSLIRTQSPAAGTLVGLGTHTITSTVTDAAGNNSKCATLVTVVDTTAPSFTTCPAPLSICVPAGTSSIPLTDPQIAAFLGTAAATDNCATPNVTHNAPAGGIPVGCGTTVVTFTATDTSGNTSTCMANINVTSMPTVTISPAAGGAYLLNTPTSFVATVTGGCGPFTYNWSFTGPGAVSVAGNGGSLITLPNGLTTAGSYIVSVTATDEKRCTASSSTTVVVVPLTANSRMRETSCNDIPNGFDAIFTPDNTSGGLRFTASNPGAFVYNLTVINTGDSSSNVRATIDIPLIVANLLNSSPSHTSLIGSPAFALWGSRPVQVFATDPCRPGVIDITSSATISICCTNSGTLSQPLSMESTVASGITISVPVPTSSMVWIRVHLKSRLLGTTGWAAAAPTGFVQNYVFKSDLTVTNSNVCSTGCRLTQPVETFFTATGKQVTAVGGNAVDVNGAGKGALRAVVHGTTVGGSPASSENPNAITENVSGFYFVPVPPGAYTAVSLYNSSGDQLAIRNTVTVPQGQFVQLDFNHLNPADPFIHGIVQAGSGIRVELHRNSRLVATTATNVAGYYSFRFAPPGTYTVRVGSVAKTVIVAMFEEARVDF